ncbi:MAG: hypothetical protein LCH54_11700 [Bacteroidetes bacterium]|nr:hypothetical protein [Bacteroidota bacterium]
MKSLTLTTIANNYPYEYVQISSVTKGVTAGTSYFLKAWAKLVLQVVG